MSEFQMPVFGAKPTLSPSNVTPEPKNPPLRRRATDCTSCIQSGICQ